MACHLRREERVPGHPLHTVVRVQDGRGPAGFARIVNRSEEAAEVDILAYDDDGKEYGPVTLSLDAVETAHFNSDDL